MEENYETTDQQTEDYDEDSYYDELAEWDREREEYDLAQSVYDELAGKIEKYRKKATQTERYTLAGLCLEIGVEYQQLKYMQRGYWQIEDVAEYKPDKVLMDMIRDVVYRVYEQIEGMMTTTATGAGRMLTEAGMFEVSEAPAEPVSLGGLTDYAV